MGDAQGRDNVTTARMALAEDGKFLGDGRRSDRRHGRLSVDIRALHSSRWRRNVAGSLRYPEFFNCRVRTVFTNTVPVDAYRGAGRPEAAYVVERLVDAAARKLGMTPDAIRRKNFIAPRRDALQDRHREDSTIPGDFTAHMKRAMEIANWKEFPKRVKAAKKQGLVRGIGLGTYVEVCGTMGEETAQRPARSERRYFNPDRHPVERAGPPRPLTAQLVAEQFGIAPERVHVFPRRYRSGRHRSRHRRLGVDTTGGVSVERATRELGKNLREIAAEALETSASDLEFNEATVRIAGTDRSITFAELAKRPGVDPSN